MDPIVFDAIAQKFAARRLARRQAGTQGGALAVSAQEATPAAVDPDIDTSTGDGAKGPTMLFVQTFNGGSVAAKEDAEDTYTLTLDGNVNSTIYFSDRPDRIVGTSPTEEFLIGLGFTDENPPNAALVVETAPGETDIAVVELFKPVLDPSGMGITYDVTVLARWQQQLDMDLQEAPTDLATLGSNFGAARLFIDDCNDYDMQCIANGEVVGYIPNADHDGFCYSWVEMRCLPCDPWLDLWMGISGTQRNYSQWGYECDHRYEACGGNCSVDSVCTGIPGAFCA